MNDRGSMTLWLVCLSACLLGVGGIGLDLWRAFEVRRGLAELVDAAASAGATMIDADRYRAGNAVVIDPVAARQRASTWLGDATGRFQVVAEAEVVMVIGERDLPLSLLRLLVPDGTLTVRVQASARPLRSP